MSAILMETRRASRIEGPIAVVLGWLLAAQNTAEQEFGLSEMPAERLADMGIAESAVHREVKRPMIWA